MGNCISSDSGSGLKSESGASDPNTDRNDKIQQQLYESQLRDLYDYKVLVLGAGESGKSTGKNIILNHPLRFFVPYIDFAFLVVKQLRLIHKQSKLDEGEAAQVRESLAKNVFDCLLSLVKACETFGFTLDPDDQSTADNIKDTEFPKDQITQELCPKLEKLWQSAPIQKAYSMRDKFWILDSVEYFMENINRFSESDFELTEEDFVMTRVRTTGIVTMEFDQPNPNGNYDWNRNIHFQVIDVGGQRSERKKWINCFDKVKAIVFVVNLSGYNMVLYEDEKKNRLQESLELFKDTVQKDIFKKTPIFLFLNKKDLFEEKIRSFDLGNCFPDYKGGKDLQSALEFVSQQFRDRMPAGNLDQFREFVIAARVKRDVKYAFEDIKLDLLKWNKKKVETEAKKVLKDFKSFQA